MLAWLFMRLKQVHRAVSQEERDAVYRFRYRVYVEELRREIGGVDHERRMVRDTEDDQPHAHHFYVGSPNDMEGVVRLRVWGPGEMPSELAGKLSMHLFGPAQARGRAENASSMVVCTALSPNRRAMANASRGCTRCRMDNTATLSALPRVSRPNCRPAPAAISPNASEAALMRLTVGLAHSGI